MATQAQKAARLKFKVIALAIICITWLETVAILRGINGSMLAASFIFIGVALGQIPAKHLVEILKHIKLGGSK